MKIFKNLTLLDQLLVSAGNFFFSVLLAKNLGVEQFGTFVLLWVGVQFLSSIQMALFVFPLFTTGTQKSSAVKKQYVAAVALQQRYFTFLAVPTLYVYYEVVCLLLGSDENSLLGAAFSLAGAAFLFHDFHRKIFIVIDDSVSLLFSDIQAYSIQLAGLWVWAHFNVTSLLNVILITLFSFLLGSLTSWARFEAAKVKISYLSLVAKANWQQSKFLVGTAILQFGGENLFVVISGSLLGPTATAVIRVLQNLMGLCHVFFVFIETHFAIKLAVLKRERNRIATENLLRNYALYGACTFLLLFIIASLVDEYIIDLIYGSKYIADAGYLKWYVVNYFFIYLTIILRVELRTLAASRAILVAAVVSVATNILTVTWIVETFGVAGAIGGLAISNGLYALLLAFGTLKGRNERYV